MAELLRFAILFAAALVAGAMNSIAGGGSLITFPALVFAGVPPIAASATNTVMGWPAALAAVLPLRALLRPDRRLLILCLGSAAGGALGAGLLLRTSPAAFQKVVPVLIAIATLLFAGAPWLLRLAREPRPAGGLANLGWSLLVSSYGGFFNAGMGIMMMAGLRLTGMRNVHRANAEKNLMSLLIVTFAAIPLIASGSVRWTEGVALTLGSTVSAYLTSRFSVRVPAAGVRTLVIAIGAVMTAIFAWRAYA